MKMSQVFSIIIISLFSVGLAVPVSNADEIEELKKRLNFLQAQKEIKSKLYKMQTNIDSLRGKVDGFQKQLDDFRVQYDLKSSTKKVSVQEKIIKLVWNTTICMADVAANFDVSIDIKNNSIDVISRDTGMASNGKLFSSNGEYRFNLDVVATDSALDGEFRGRVTPTGGTATLDLPECGTAQTELVLVKD